MLKKNELLFTPTLSGSDIVYAVGLAAAQPFENFFLLFIVDWFLCASRNIKEISKG